MEVHLEEGENLARNAQQEIKRLTDFFFFFRTPPCSNAGFDKTIS